jgi:hypothetical protein
LNIGFQKTDLEMYKNMTNSKITAGSSIYPQVMVQWLNQALCFHQNFCLDDSEVIQNRQLWFAAKRYANSFNKPLC